MTDDLEQALSPDLREWLSSPEHVAQLRYWATVEAERAADRDYVQPHQGRSLLAVWDPEPCADEETLFRAVFWCVHAELIGEGVDAVRAVGVAMRVAELSEKLSGGWNQKEAAEELGVSPATAKRDPRGCVRWSGPGRLRMRGRGGCVPCRP